MDATPCRPCWPSPSVPKQTTSACFCLCLAWWVCVSHKPEQREPGPSGPSGWFNNAFRESGSSQVLCGGKKITLTEWNTLPWTESLPCPSPVLSSWRGRQEQSAVHGPRLTANKQPPIEHRALASNWWEQRPRTQIQTSVPPLSWWKGSSIQNMYHFIPVSPCIGFQFPPGIKCIQRRIITEETHLLKTTDQPFLLPCEASSLQQALGRWEK